MYIKKVKKKNKGFEKEFSYLHLVESVRTDKGPRQKLILNLGPVNIDESKYKELAECIEGLLGGAETLFPFDEEIVTIAESAKNKIVMKNSEEEPSEQADKEFTPCDLGSLQASQSRTVGPEHVALQTWSLLKLDDAFTGLSDSQISLCKGQVISRLCNPGSDRSSWDWLLDRSGLYELTTMPRTSSLGSFYKGADYILNLKTDIEAHLNKREASVFNLPKKFCLFDLTNTFLEGRAMLNDKAQRGRSKEKRSDCKLLTLGMIVDENGFPEKTLFFEGNKSEPATLESMIEGLLKDNPSFEKRPSHILLDAGIATKENLEYLAEKGFKYVVVSRGKADCSLKKSDLESLKISKSGSHIKVKREVVGDEALLLCHSDQKELKEESMLSAKEEKLISELQKIQDNLADKTKKRVARKHDKILEKVGRLREKYSYAAKYFEIKVTPDKDKNDAIALSWSIKTEKKNKKETGCYLLRTNDLDLLEIEIWDIYNLLTRVEAGFRSIKSDTGLRPIYHQLESRSNAHMFISVLAYHLLNAIEYQLRNAGDTRTWSTIRDVLSSHTAISINIETLEDSKVVPVNIRMCTIAESAHVEIYNALNLSTVPFKRKVTKIKL